MLIELAWPDDAPVSLGFASPLIEGDTYIEGWMYLNPVIRSAPTGVVRRLVLHELGHLYGLGDVADPAELMNSRLTAQDWGVGDLVGLLATHRGGCAGAELAPRLLVALDD